MTPKWTEGLFNPSLTWGRDDQYDFGVDMDLFNYRLNIVLDYYYRYTDKLLYNITLPGNYSGYTKQWQMLTQFPTRVSSYRLNGDIMRKDSFKWDLTLILPVTGIVWRKAIMVWIFRLMVMLDILIVM